MAFVEGVEFGDFCPEGGGMIHVMGVGEFVEEDVVAEGFREFHEGDVERDGAGAAAAAPAGAGVGETVADVFVAVFFGEVFEAVGEFFFGAGHEELFLGVAAALGGGVAEGEVFFDLFSIAVEEAFDEEVGGVGGDGKAEATGGRDGKTNAATEAIFPDEDFAEFAIV